MTVKIKKVDQFVIVQKIWDLSKNWMRMESTVRLGKTWICMEIMILLKTNNGKDAQGNLSPMLKKINIQQKVN